MAFIVDESRCTKYTWLAASGVQKRPINYLIIHTIKGLTLPKNPAYPQGKINPYLNIADLGISITVDNTLSIAVNIPGYSPAAVKGQKKATASCHTPNRVYTK